MAAMRIAALLTASLAACVSSAALGERSSLSLAGRLAGEQQRAEAATGVRLSAERAANLPAVASPAKSEENEVATEWRKIQGTLALGAHQLLARFVRLESRLRGRGEQGAAQEVTLAELLFVVLCVAGACCLCGCCCMCCTGILGTAAIYSVRLQLLMDEKDRMEKRMPRHIKEKVGHPDYRALCDHVFDEADAASIGELQSTQLRHAVMQSYGQDLQNERFFMELFDSDKSGTINKEEFFQIMKFYEFYSYEKEWGKQPDPESGYEYPDPNANEPFEPEKLVGLKAIEAN